MRKTTFANKEHYHIFNRGADKCAVILDQYDMERFLQSIDEFNSIRPIGSIYENSFRKQKHNGNQLGNSVSKLERLVNIVCYCINQNHYHFILQQLSDKGIEKFMHRFGVGYTKYFNKKYNRSGVLFQGAFKAVHIDSNEYLLHLSAYVNLNNRAHKLGNSVSKSSWEEYVKGKNGFCHKDVVLHQFNNGSEYEAFAEKSLEDILLRKDMEKLLFETAI